MLVEYINSCCTGIEPSPGFASTERTKQTAELKATGSSSNAWILKRQDYRKIQRHHQGKMASVSAEVDEAVTADDVVCHGANESDSELHENQLSAPAFASLPPAAAAAYDAENQATILTPPASIDCVDSPTSEPHNEKEKRLNYDDRVGAFSVTRTHSLTTTSSADEYRRRAIPDDHDDNYAQDPDEGEILVSATVVMDLEEAPNATVHRSSSNQEGFGSRHDFAVNPSSLVVENVVVDESEEIFPESQTMNRIPIVEAAPMDDTFSPRKKRRRILLATLPIVVGVGIALAVGLSVVRNNTNNAQGTTPLQVPSDSTLLGNTRESFVRDVLPESTRYALQNSSSFQTTALDWLWTDPVTTGALPSFRRVQRFALATMALSLSSDVGHFGIEDVQAIGWLTDAHECTWKTPLALSSVCDAQGRYRKLDASGFSLAGTIPVEISLLTDLTQINLSYNRIRGSIPTEVGLVPLLEQFILSNASLVSDYARICLASRLCSSFCPFLRHPSQTGSIPSEIGLLSELITIDVIFNEISGTIPSELGLLTKLSRFFLDGNDIVGTLPSQIGQLVELRAISVRGNSISGTLPTEVGRWEFAYGLAFSNNSFTGTLPTELGELSSLEMLDFRANDWTGAIPSELGLLSRLDVAVLHDSLLMGSVPWQVCSLINRTLELFTVDCSKVTDHCNCTCSDAVVDGFVQKFSDAVSQFLQVGNHKITL